MSRIELKYKGRGDLVFTLYHAEYCEKAAACECRIDRVARPVTDANGATGTAYVKVVTPRSVYLSAGGEAVGVNRVALNLQQVADAIKQGLIEVKEEADAKAPVVAATDSEASEPRGRKR